MSGFSVRKTPMPRALLRFFLLVALFAAAIARAQDVPAIPFEKTKLKNGLEVMMVAGSKHVPRGMADQLTEAVGATDSNGSTWFDRTNYFDTWPSDQLELGLWIQSDRMGYLLDVLDQTALSNQQDVVRNERRQSIESVPYGIVDEALYHSLFPATHPYQIGRAHV